MSNAVRVTHASNGARRRSIWPPPTIPSLITLPEPTPCSAPPDACLAGLVLAPSAQAYIEARIRWEMRG